MRIVNKFEKSNTIVIPYQKNSKFPFQFSYSVTFNSPTAKLSEHKTEEEKIRNFGKHHHFGVSGKKGSPIETQ